MPPLAVRKRDEREIPFLRRDVDGERPLPRPPARRAARPRLRRDTFESERLLDTGFRRSPHGPRIALVPYHADRVGIDRKGRAGFLPQIPAGKIGTNRAGLHAVSRPDTGQLPEVRRPPRPGLQRVEGVPRLRAAHQRPHRGRTAQFCRLRRRHAALAAVTSSRLSARRADSRQPRASPRIADAARGEQLADARNHVPACGHDMGRAPRQRSQTETGRRPAGEVRRYWKSEIRN
jgi:hypothetical protein